MRKIHTNENGLAHVIGVIMIVVVFGLIGIVAYRIYQGRDTVARNNPAPEPVFQNPQSLAQAHNALGFNLLRDFNHGQEENIFISPTSISLALSMVYNRADGETKRAIARTMQIQHLDTAQLNQESLGLIQQLHNRDAGVELAIANSVWAKKGVDFKPVFLKTVADYYQAQSTVLDFKDPNAPDEINAWVSKNTRGKIPSIIKSIPSDMVMYLINATYFKGTWTTAFDPRLTEDNTFKSSTGSSKQVPFMRQKNEFSYYENDEFQSVSLPYGKNKELSMYVFLPNDLQKFTDSIEISNWNQWMPQFRATEGTVILPRFKLEYEKELKGALTKLGMGVAFGEQADFAGIGSNLQISEIKHKTYVDVNEEGTEAAAVTGIGVGITSLPPEKKEFYMEVNRPFLFAITDNTTGEILFIGAIHNP